jgi:uncharacterized protein
MKVINRAVLQNFIQRMRPGKVMSILGPRRVGKSLFLKQIMKELREKEEILYLNGEDMTTAEILKRRTVENYLQILGTKRLLIIDEAQKVPDIGWILKLMVDEIDGLRVIATGSAAFDLRGGLGEPLTGRKIEFIMLPFAEMELAKEETAVQAKERLEERLIFGSYPELFHIKDRNEKAEYLREIMNSYLLKDILGTYNLNNSTKLIDLLRLLAHQVGEEVSVEELGKNLGMSKNTVNHYLDLLANVFVIFKLTGFSRNLRKEVTKKNKWFFYDNGIRNALIANFNPLYLRENDVGKLWENYIIAERLKFQHITGYRPNNYFWRTYQQQEVDWVEEVGGEIHGFELKWSPAIKVKPPSNFVAYDKTDFKVIHRDNYRPWIFTSIDQK